MERKVGDSLLRGSHEDKSSRRLDRLARVAIVNGDGYVRGGADPTLKLPWVDLFLPFPSLSSLPHETFFLFRLPDHPMAKVTPLRDRVVKSRNLRCGENRLTLRIIANFQPLCMFSLNTNANKAR